MRAQERLPRFTDNRDPSPRSREVFSFHRPETFAESLKQDKPLRITFFAWPVSDVDAMIIKFEIKYLYLSIRFEKHLALSLFYLCNQV